MDQSTTDAKGGSVGGLSAIERYIVKARDRKTRSSQRNHHRTTSTWFEPVEESSGPLIEHTILLATELPEDREYSMVSTSQDPSPPVLGALDLNQYSSEGKGGLTAKSGQGVLVSPSAEVHSEHAETEVEGETEGQAEQEMREYTNAGADIDVDGKTEAGVVSNANSELKAHADTNTHDDTEEQEKCEGNKTDKVQEQDNNNPAVNQTVADNNGEMKTGQGRIHKQEWDFYMMSVETENKVVGKTLDAKKQTLIAAIHDVTETTVLSLCRALNPPQTVINLIIGYVSLLQKTGRNSLLSQTWTGLSKTYLSCVRALQDVGCIMRHTASLVHSLPQTSAEGLMKILHIRQKYIVGIDMKENLVHHQAPGARAILKLLDTAIDYAEVIAAINSLGLTQPEHQCQSTRDSPGFRPRPCPSPSPSPSSRIANQKADSMQESARKATKLWRDHCKYSKWDKDTTNEAKPSRNPTTLPGLQTV